MMSNASLLILPGDGIGPEVMAEVKKIISWMGAKRAVHFDVSEGLVGGCSYDAHGTPLTDETMAQAQAVDAVLLGAVGGPKYDVLDFSVKPERGLLRLRKEMDLFSNLRPAQCFDALADFSSLKKDVVAGLDIVIVRELTSGVYFGEPRGIFTEGNERVGINTQRYTESEIARVARSRVRACAQARQQGLFDGKGQRDGIGHFVARSRPRRPRQGIRLMSSCRTCMQMQAQCSLCRWPKQFDVIVTDNLFGDLLSDDGGHADGHHWGCCRRRLWVLPMANGRPKALYEPVHGSAPDIAGPGQGEPDCVHPSFAHGAALFAWQRKRPPALKPRLKRSWPTVCAPPI